MDIHAILEFRAKYRKLETLAEKQHALKEFIKAFQEGITIQDRAQFLFDLKQLIEPDATNISELFTSETDETIQAIIEKNNQFEAEAQKNSGAEENLLPDDLLHVNNRANNYGFNRALYDEILPLTKLAYMHEKNGTPEEHAYKLAIMFKDENAVIAYLNCRVFVKNKVSLVSLHDACLFDIPESPPNWNIEAWRNLATKTNNLASNAEFKKILKNAGKIEKYILDNLEKILTAEELKNTKPAKIIFLKKLQGLKKETQELQTTLQAMRAAAEPTEKISRQAKKLEDKQTKFKKTFESLLQMFTVPELTEIAATFTYVGAEKNVAAALLCHEYGLSQRDFDLVLNLKPQDSDAIPDVTLLGADIDSSYGSYYLKKLDSTDPRAFVLGKMTGCCQSIGGAGEGCAIHGITSPNGGFYVICKKGNGQSPKATDPIVAQCWAWRGKDNGLVFDSIEYTEAIEEGKIKKTNRPLVAMIEDMYTHLAFKLVDEEKYAIPRVMVGTGGQTPKTMGWDAIGNSVTAERFSDYQGHSDSKHQHVLASSNFPGYLYAHIKNIEQPDDFDNFWLKKIDNWFLNNKSKINEMLGPPPLNILQDWIASCIGENKKEILQHFKQHLSLENQEKFERILKSSQEMYQERQKPIEKLDFSLIKKLVEQGVSVDFPIKGQDSLLMLAFKAQNINVLKELLNLGADINATDKDRMTALRYAVENNRLDVVELLLEKGANVNAKDKDGMTALLYAAKLSRLAVIKLLLAKGANVDAKGNDGMTALQYATEDGQLDMVEFLLDNGANVDAKNTNGRTALLYASLHRRWDMVKLLLKKNANVNVTDENGMSAFIYAAENGRWDVVTLLLEKYTDVNVTDTYGMTALQYAARYAWWDAVKLLLEKNANVNVADKNGMTPLLCAAQDGQWDVVKLLLEKNADVDAKNENGMTALLYAAKCGQWDVVEFLLQKNANVNVTDTDGMTALLYAALYGRWDVVKLLLKKCTDVDAKNKDGRTALLHAALCGRWDVVTLLLEKCTDVDAKNEDGMTTLLYATKHDQWDAVKLLLKKCTDVDAKDRFGMTTLLYAAKDGQLDVVKLLLEKGANVDAKDEDGMTALQYAASYRRWDVVELLQEKLKKDASTPPPIIFGEKSISTEPQSQEENLAKPNNKKPPPRSSI